MYGVTMQEKKTCEIHFRDKYVWRTIEVVKEDKVNESTIYAKLFIKRLPSQMQVVVIFNQSQ